MTKRPRSLKLDLTWIALPICVVVTIVLVALGVPQNLDPYVEATTLEGARQTISQGPVASQMMIKHLGTNGGGFFNANAAHPYENPSAFTNFIHIVSIFAIGAALTNVFGRRPAAIDAVAASIARKSGALASSTISGTTTTTTSD